VSSVFDLKFFWEVFVTLLVITDPPGTVPVFLGLTAQRPARERNRLAWQAAVMALGGWSGSDNSPTLAQFEQYVKDGKITYFISSGQRTGGGGGQGDALLIRVPA